MCDKLTITKKKKAYNKIIIYLYNYLYYILTTDPSFLRQIRIEKKNAYNKIII